MTMLKNNKCNKRERMNGMSVRIIAMLFCLLFSGLINRIESRFSGDCECEKMSEHPEWLWCDDFESGESLKEKYQDVSTSGLSVSEEDVFEGNYSLKQTYTKGQDGAGWIIKVNNSGFPDHLFMRFYHKFEGNYESFPPKMARIRYRQRSGSWDRPCAVHFWISNSKAVADVKAINSSQANSSGYLSKAVSDFSFKASENVNRWICFEMEVRLNTPGKKDGLYRIWADDNLIIERTNVDLRGNKTYKINEVMLDCYWNGGAPSPHKRFYDNFIISTEKIGPVKMETDIKFKPQINENSHKSGIRPVLYGVNKAHNGTGTGVYLLRKNDVFSIDGKKVDRNMIGEIQNQNDRNIIKD